MTSRLPIASAALLLAASTTHLAAQPTPAAADTSVATMRRAFDFLVGSWRVESRTDSSGTTPSQGETYTFEKALDGVVLSGRWHFNRGTLAQPDFADAAYYSGFDTRARAWSFYYVSPQSAQYWPGALRDGRWEFTRSFTLNDKPMVQRQRWERVDDTTVRRHVENSGDGGRTWTSLVITLRRR